MNIYSGQLTLQYRIISMIMLRKLNDNIQIAQRH